jgi:hypothetical protein
MNDLIQKYLEAKQKELKAIEERVKLAEQIAAQLESKEEGSTTHKVNNYKVCIKKTINRRVDWEEFNQLSLGRENIPVKIKQELDEPGLKWIRENEPEYYKQLCTCITARPGRVAVEITELTEE